MNALAAQMQLAETYDLIRFVAILGGSLVSLVVLVVVEARRDTNRRKS